jgi:DNA-binding protein YbaB
VQDDDPLLNSLARLGAEADEYAQRLAKAQDPKARFEGSDDSGAVTAIVDADGRVREVTVDRLWQRHIAVTALDDAVRAAVQAATLSRLQAFDTALGEQFPVGPPVRTDFLSDAVRARLAKLSGGGGAPADRLPAAQELLAMLEAVDESLDRLGQQVRDQMERPHSGHSAARHVTATVNGSGELLGIEFDRRWLVNAHEYNIAREIREALQAAYALAGKESVQSLIARSPLGDIAQLRTDPAEIIRRPDKR